MKNRIILLFSLLLGLTSAYAGNANGQDSVSSEWFREWYQWGELRHYLDNYSDFVTYQTETTGEWGTPEPYIMSINGNSFRWSRYYLDGFRINSRFQPGDMLLSPDMFDHSLVLDYNRGSLNLYTDSVRSQHVELRGNAGGVGGVSPSAHAILYAQTQHHTAIDRVYKEEEITNRKHILGAGAVNAVYGIRAFGQTFYQHATANYGVRRNHIFDYQGISGNYDAPYYQVQLDGLIPLPKNNVIDQLNYIINAKSRADYLSEFSYNSNEVADLVTHSFSVYAKKDFDNAGQLTTGLTYGLNNVCHQDLNFTRNVADQDGESFEPWYADGHTHELNWAVNYNLDILPWLSFHLDAYNSLMHFDPTTTSWHNDLYYQSLGMNNPVSLYRVDWASSSFTSGLLENTAQLKADYWPLSWMRLRGSLGVTLNGMLVGKNNVVTPAAEAEFDLYMHPAKWFAMDVIIGNYSVPYSYDQVQYLSDKYMNGVVTYANSGTSLTTTGGAYHSVASNLLQPQYVAIDIPLHFYFGKHNEHEIVLYSSLKKYYNTWTTELADDCKDTYTAIPVTNHRAASITYDVYAMQPTERHYVVMMDTPVPGNFLFGTPMFASNVFKYSYTGKKVFVSFSWQSYMVTGPSTFGSGILSNDINALTESTADPNNFLTNANMQQTNAYARRMGRVDQDRAFIARLQLGVNITENWQLSLSGKFRDGTPFVHYHTVMYQTTAGDNQAVLWRGFTEGTNPVDQNFGERKDSFFNFDLRLKYRGTIKDVPFQVSATCYNVWDFATELYEYCFDAVPTSVMGISGNRYALSLSIPRGLAFSFSVGLEKNK